MHRRPAAALLAALVAAAAVLVSPMPQSVRAATSGTAGIALSASCVPVDPNSDTPDSRDITVRGHGFDPGSTVDIYVNVVGSESFPDPSDTRKVDDLGVFVGKVSLSLPGASLTYVLTAVTRGQDAPQAEANVTAPCPPTVEVTPTCMAPDAPFDISFVADGFSPGGSVQVGLYLPRSTTPVVSDPLTADADGHVEYTFTGVGPLPAGTYQAAAVEGSNRAIVARIATNGLVAQTPIELPCPTPEIALSPDCAPAGAPQDRYDVTVTGTGFAYGPAVLTWDVGGSEEEFRIEQVGDNGVFSIRIDPWQRPQGSRIRVRVTQTFPLEPGSGENENVLGPNATASAPPRVARATFRVPCRPTATPVMTLDPDCDTPALVGDAERRYDIGVSASGLVPGPVDIVFDAGAAAADVTPPEHFPGEVGKDGQLADVTITPLARPVDDYRVSLLQGETSVIERTFQVPCEKPTAVVRPIQPTCGPIAPDVPESYSIRVRGRGFYPGTVELTFDQKGTPEVQSATVGADGTFDVRLAATGRDRGDHIVLARQRDARGTLLRGSRVFTVPCVEPTMVIAPLAGSAGTTTVVTGTDFPPGSTVTLTWDRGITAATPVEVTADQTGAFEVSIFLLPHDIPGPRVLTAGTPNDPAAFPGVTADYLVVEGTGQPPGSRSDPGAVIFRR
jgi:hypothetical protein